MQKTIAENLLQIKAIKLSVEKPFTWASGWKSPIYCDNRKALSFPSLRTQIKTGLSDLIRLHFSHAEWVAGVATAGIAWGALVSEDLDLPFLYVRPKPKEHGLQNQIEGYYEQGRKVIVVEDLISTGKSSLQVVEVLKKEGLQVLGMVSIFNYGFPIASQAFGEAGIPFYSLSDYNTLIEVAVQKGYVSNQEEKALLNWRLDPAKW
ncbi:MAG: orotate phosphoribosyltransferase [Bacteroidota bacterium]|nr:orotate phosphoribosyltransferase [Bacteroidota bacterium]